MFLIFVLIRYLHYPHRYAHYPYVLDFNFKLIEFLNYSLTDFDFECGDYQGLTNSLTAGDYSFINDLSITFDVKLAKFHEILYEKIARYVPTPKFSTPDSPPSFNRELGDAIKKKLRLHYQWKIHQSDDYFYLPNS